MAGGEKIQWGLRWKSISPITASLNPSHEIRSKNAVARPLEQFCHRSSLRMPSLFLLLRLISVVGFAAFAQGLNYDEAHHCYQDVLVSNVNFITSTVRLDLVWFNQLHPAKYHFQVGVSPDLLQDSWPQVKKSPQLKIHRNAVKIKFEIPEIKFAAEKTQKCSENRA